MGMVLTARMLTTDEMTQALSSPEALSELLHPDDGSGEREVDVDKAWHGIHWLLTGSGDDRPPAPRKKGLFRKAEPAPEPGAEWLPVLGGDPVGDDEGYGPARLLRPEQVAAVAQALGPITPEVLASRVDLAAMDAEGLYPSIWDEDDVYETYLGPNYAALREFYLEAARDGAAVLLAIQ